MNKKTLSIVRTGTIALSLLFLPLGQVAFAEDDAETKTVVLVDGTNLAIIIANSPAVPPGGVKGARNIARTPAQKDGDVKITGVPAFDWSYGSSATAAAMIAGYYDRVGFMNMYTGPTDRGCMPLTNESWGISNIEGSECPLSATRLGVDGRATRGHVDDYYVSEGDEGPDPYFENWDEHDIGECTGDYMKTSKWFADSSIGTIFTDDINKDGAAAFVLDISGAPMSASDLEANTYNQYDAGYGLKLFFESRGYVVASMYNQYINPFKNDGFSYEQYTAEIDAGRPVMLHLSGHIVVGIGYNLTNSEMIFHDSWSHNEHTMIWGGVYNTLFTHDAVTIVTLADSIDPGAKCRDEFPWPMFLPAITNPK